MIELIDIGKSFENEIVFNNINLKINNGECICFIGKSGCGKTTLLNIIGMLDQATHGKYYLDGKLIPRKDNKEMRLLFENRFGYLFQNYALIDDETVYYNLDLACKGKKNHNIISKVLAEVGLDGFEKKKIYQLSGGQQQKVAIARLMLKDSDIILCDEPTGSLDHNSRDGILDLLKQLRSENKIMIIVTHDPVVARWCDKIYKL